MRRGRVLAIALAMSLLVAVAAGAQSGLFVTTSDFATGSTAYLAPGAATAQTDLLNIHSDAMAKYCDGRIYIVNRLGQDNVIVLDPSDWTAPVAQFSVGNGSNPQDIEILSPVKAYVSRFASTEILIVHPETGAELGTIDLSAWADDDGLPEISRMVLVGSRLYVAVQRLDRDGTWGPVDQSYLVVIDTNTEALVDVDPATDGVQGITLAAPNPGTLIAVGTKIIVGEVSAFGDVLGGIDVVDTETNQSLGLAVTEEALGGDLGAVAMVTATRGYAVISDASFANNVVPFDLTTGQVGEPLAGLSGGYLQAIAADGNRLIVGERGSYADPSVAGLMIYDAASGDLIAGPIPTGLPPSSIAVLGDAAMPTAVEMASAVVPVVSRLRAAYPNPFNASTVIPFEIAGATSVRLTVRDVLGRRVRTVVDGVLQPGSYTATWNGLDESGAVVGNGTYIVELRSGQLRSSHKVTLLK